MVSLFTTLNCAVLNCAAGTQLRGTDCLHCTHEYEAIDSDRKKSQ